MKLQNKAFEAHIRNRPRKGWSLVELLFVMLIIVSLAGMIAAAAGPVKSRIARYRAEGRLKALQTALDGYKAEYGSYPICEDPQDGSRILYTALYGDYNGNGMPDHFPEDEDDPAVKTFMEKLRPPSLDAQGRPIGGGSSMVMPDGDS
ncbi:MAG: type II secretion system protein, partial [Verrucomicrobiota bacterium]